MSATAKFYTAFFLALAIVVATGVLVGVRIGRRPDPRVAEVEKFRSCLKAAKRETTTVNLPAREKLADLFSHEQDCAKVFDLPFFSAVDVYETTGVTISGSKSERGRSGLDP